jgi:hypothetical protein
MEMEDLLQLRPCLPSTLSPGWVADELTRRGKLLVLWGRNSVVASGEEQFMIGETARQSVDVIYDRLFISDEVRKLDVLKGCETTMFARAESRFANSDRTSDPSLPTVRSNKSVRLRSNLSFSSASKDSMYSSLLRSASGLTLFI